jgi:hypothetical protein
MSLASANFVAIALAAAASFLFGGVWYGALSKAWLAAIGKSEEDIRKAGRSMPFLFALTIVAQLVMAWVLAGILWHMGPTQVGVRSGMIVAALCWLGFVLTTLVVNHGYQGDRWSLTVIDGGHWLGVLLIQGAILGAMGVAR